LWDRVGGGRGELVLDSERCFDHRGSQPGGYMPFYVAVEEPYSRIVRSKTQNDVSVWSNEDSIASHGCRVWSWSVVWVVKTCVVVAAGYDLEGMTVEMEGVFSRVVIVQYDFHNFVLSKDESVCVTAVYDRVCSIGAGGKDGVQGGYFGADISNIVEKGIIRAIVEVIHLQV
jgi:hypothetical protein